MILGKLFHFQIFQTFENLEMDFGIDFWYLSDKLSILSELWYFLLT